MLVTQFYSSRGRDLHEGRYDWEVFSENENNTVCLRNLQIQSELVGEMSGLCTQWQHIYTKTWHIK